MFRIRVRSATCALSRPGVTISVPTRTLATATTTTPASHGTGTNHKVVVVGGGTAGLAISHQLLRSGKFSQDDIALVDPARWHHYQPGWTLVGGGLKSKQDLRRPLHQLLDSKMKWYNDAVTGFEPEQRTVRLEGDRKVGYEQLVVAPGIKVDFGSVGGLQEALAESPASGVSSIYGYESVDKVFETIERFGAGQALFTQPAGGIKCAGAPQKIMWLALDHWKRAGLYDSSSGGQSPIKIAFATGGPSMFAVKKYSAALEEMRKERGVEGLFCHDLVSIDNAGRTATFVSTNPDTAGQKVTRQFDLLHVVPKMGPYPFVKDSVLANQAGYVDVDDGTTRHKKYPNVWSAGDASSLPTSKTAAAITAEAPVLVHNLLASLDKPSSSSSSSEKSGAEDAIYDGYTSCPLLTEYGKVMLAEFKYGAEPKETFGDWVDQAVPRREFYHLKKDFFPWVYYQSLVKGTWGGPKGWIR